MTHLWLLPERHADRFAARLGGERLLAEDERARLARKVTPRARRMFLAGRLLCRHALSARTGRPPDQWRFGYGPFGRPEPEPDGDGVRFSLSHTRGFLACAVSHGRSVGVDVEHRPASAESAGHVARFFSAEERAELAALAPADRVARTGELWVLKEAYLKGLGTGLHRGLDGFSFTPRAADRIAVHDPERPTTADSGSDWWFELLHPGPLHALAIAVEGGRAGVLHTPYRLSEDDDWDTT